jgi:hypothetical protein
LGGFPYRPFLPVGEPSLCGLTPRILRYIDKRIDPDMIRTVVRRLTERGIGVKSYFILGFPGETADELAATVRLVHELNATSSTSPSPPVRRRARRRSQETADASATNSPVLLIQPAAGPDGIMHPIDLSAATHSSRFGTTECRTLSDLRHVR